MLQNAVSLSGDRVLRIDVIGLRLETDVFMDQVPLGLASVVIASMYQRVRKRARIHRPEGVVG